jgi:hypothetical protein
MSQLADMFKGLMFLHGHILRPEDVAPPSPQPGNRVASERRFAAHGDGGHGAARDPGFSLAEHLAFLGGRPMHAGHNLDLEEPFEQLGEMADDRAAAQACATC